MHPTLIHRPDHHDSWVYAEKVDGWRMLATNEGHRSWLVATGTTTTAAGHCLVPEPLTRAGERGEPERWGLTESLHDVASRA